MNLSQTTEELNRDIPVDKLTLSAAINSLGAFDIPKTKITLDEWKLRELWCKGIINDLSYITFALELESKAMFNIDSFTRKWENVELSEEQQDDGWKSKKLKLRTVLNVIAALGERGMGCCEFNVKVSQLSLFD
jgi:hypothetical protein